MGAEAGRCARSSAFPRRPCNGGIHARVGGASVATVEETLRRASGAGWPRAAHGSGGAACSHGGFLSIFVCEEGRPYSAQAVEEPNRCPGCIASPLPSNHSSLGARRREAAKALCDRCSKTEGLRESRQKAWLECTIVFLAVWAQGAGENLNKIALH